MMRLIKKWSSCLIRKNNMTNIEMSLLLILISYNKFFYLIESIIIPHFLYKIGTTKTNIRYNKNMNTGYDMKLLCAVLNKSWKQYPTKQQLYSYLPLISQAIQVRGTRHVGHCWKSKDEVTFFNGPLYMDPSMLADQQEFISISSVWTLNVVRKTWWD